MAVKSFIVKAPGDIYPKIAFISFIDFVTSDELIIHQLVLKIYV